MSLLDGALILQGLDEAIEGQSDCGRLIYSYNKVVNIFISQGMTQEEAIDYIDYNVFGVKCNGEGFIMMYDYLQ
jgi:hypothetical protein|tara:strand:- start:41 stop:262 length:222 start_codon:yes stop_codon:yes gene_type:complete